MRPARPAPSPCPTRSPPQRTPALTQRPHAARRYAKLPFTVQELRDRGVVIHAVLISHSHYDHLCLETVRALGDGPRYFVGLGLAAWFRDNGVHNVHEMDWWDEARFAPPDVPGGAGVSVVCTPCQHWSARTAWDPFKTLWCSWAVLRAPPHPRSRASSSLLLSFAPANPTPTARHVS